MNYFPIKILANKLWINEFSINKVNFNILKNYRVYIEHNGILEKVSLIETNYIDTSQYFCFEINLLVKYEGDTTPTDLVKLKLIS